MQLVPVASHSIAAIGYEGGVLVVAFRTGGVWRYQNVPPVIAAQFQAAPSKGRFYARMVRGRFPSVHVG